MCVLDFSGLPPQGGDKESALLAHVINSALSDYMEFMMPERHLGKDYRVIFNSEETEDFISVFIKNKEDNICKKSSSIAPFGKEEAKFRAYYSMVKELIRIGLDHYIVNHQLFIEK